LMRASIGTTSTSPPIIRGAGVITHKIAREGDFFAVSKSR
jgi:hypothetical protein